MYRFTMYSHDHCEQHRKSSAGRTVPRNAACATLDAPLTLTTPKAQPPGGLGRFDLQQNGGDGGNRTRGRFPP